MSLFNVSDLETPAEGIDENRVFSYSSSLCADVVAYNDQTFLDAIKEMDPGAIKYLISNGGISVYQVLEKLVQICSPCEVRFTTWAISEAALGILHNGLDSGDISHVQAVLDVGNRNRKEKTFDLFKSIVKEHAFKHCHAKVLVVTGSGYHFTLIGSANMTKNPRKEVGVLFNDAVIAQMNIEWISHEIDTSRT